ncbi:MAG: spore coat protein U domain-containing protein [Pseudomonadota bacterium]
MWGETITLVTATICATPAAAQCVNARFGNANDVVITGDIGGYDGFDPDENIEPTSVAVELLEGSDCTVALAVKSAAGDTRQRTMTTETGDQLSYSLFASESGRTVLLNSIEPQRDSTLTAFLPTTGGETPIPFFVAIPPGQIVRTGSYSDQVTFRLYTVEEGTFTLVSEVPGLIQTDVPEKVDISISITDRDFDINLTTAILDFGELETDETGQAFIRIRSNGDYSLIASSQNGGRLLHEEFGTRAAVSYSGSMSGIPFRFGEQDASATSLRGKGPTTNSGDAHRVDVRIGDVGSLPAGAYRDIITFSVTPEL